MTTPTQAQIEAARNEYLNRCGHYKPPSDETFAAILTAAAQVGDMRTISASEVACYKWPDDTPEHKALRAAYVGGAEVGEPKQTPDEIYEAAFNEGYEDAKESYIASTIERCAQVAEQHVCTECSAQIAAAIRKLKTHDTA